MTPEELQRALSFRQQELQALSAALGADIIAAMNKNKRLDDPEQAFRLRLRSVIDHAAGLIAEALIHAKETSVAATMDAKLAELEKHSYHSDHLAEATPTNHVGETEGLP